MDILALPKDRLRSKYLTLRKELSRDFVKKSSQLVAQRVLSLKEMAGTKFVSAYLAINNEVDTKQIIDGLTKRGVKIFLPKYSGGSQVNTPGAGSDSPGVRNDSEYVFAEFTSWRNLERGPFGILQPKINPSNTSGIGFDSSNKTNTSEVGSDSSEVRIDIAIIPGVAFDKNGTRLGYGKGVFDRLLAGSKAVKIGLAYDFQIVKKLPRQSHDLQMDYVITEEEVILC